MIIVSKRFFQFQSSTSTLLKSAIFFFNPQVSYLQRRVEKNSRLTIRWFAVACDWISFIAIAWIFRETRHVRARHVNASSLHQRMWRLTAVTPKRNKMHSACADGYRPLCITINNNNVRKCTKRNRQDRRVTGIQGRNARAWQAGTRISSSIASALQLRQQDSSGCETQGKEKKTY